MAHHENDGLSRYGGRNVVGYGSSPPHPQWPRNAKVALNFVLNYEEGGERCLLHGDETSEFLMSEVVGEAPRVGERNLTFESLYDYGSRAGFWRLFRTFKKKKIPCTVFAVGMALERNPLVCQELQECEDWEIASHGYRWIDYSEMDEKTELEHIKRTIEIHEKLLGKRPVGYYQGSPTVNTRRLLAQEGGFKYDSDSYSDDLPYWNMDNRRPHLIIPYTLSENDMKFASFNGFATGDDFCKHLKDTLRFLIEEGRAGAPKMMSVGLHGRLARPGRVAALEQFIDFAKSYGRDVWICTREQIAEHWYENHIPRGRGSQVISPSDLDPKESSEEESENNDEEGAEKDQVEDK